MCLVISSSSKLMTTANQTDVSAAAEAEAVAEAEAAVPAVPAAETVS